MSEMLSQEKRAENMRSALMTPRVQAQLTAALPSVGLTAQRFARMALTTFTLNPDLYTCTPESVIRALIVCAQFGLAPTGAFGAHLVPFQNHRTGKKEVVVIPDYRGLIARSWRSNRLRRVVANIVREGEAFDYEEGDSAFLKHKPGMSKDGKPVSGDAPVLFIYALAHLTGDAPASFVVLTVEAVEWYRSKSKAKNSPAWRDDWNAMACKTALRRLFESGRMPMQDDDQRLVEMLQGEDVGVDVPALEKLSPEEIAAMKATPVEVTNAATGDETRMDDDDDEPMPDPNSPEGKALAAQLDAAARAQRK